MTFAKPEMLWLLALTLPLLTWFLVWAWRKKQHLIGKFVQSRLLAQLTVGVSRGRQKLRLVTLAAAVGLLLVALARPQLGYGWEEVRQRGLDIIVGLDTSRSMLATDLTPNRMTRAKLAALDLLKSAENDRLGIVAFAGTAFLQCPLTVDHSAFAQSLNALEVGMLPEGGTDLTRAIETAQRAFGEDNDSFKVVILLTDGEDHEGDPVPAARKAAESGLRIFTIGVGTAEGERLRVRDEQGRTTFVADEDGKPVVSKLNIELLQQVAAAAQGEYLALRGATTMDLLYAARLEPLPKIDLAVRRVQLFHERFQWPLALAIGLLIFEVFFPERRRAERGPTASAVTNTELKRAVALLVAGAFLTDASASSGSAKKAYEEGQFKDALKEYQRLLEKKPDDPRLAYNAGTTAYRSGDLEAATNALASALLSTDPELLARAYYNLGNTHYRLGEKAGDPSATIPNWQLALTNYQSALKLNPQDADANFNRQLVQQRIEELLKQQPPPQDQQQNQKDPKDDKDQKDQKDQQKQPSKDEQKSDQPKPDQPQPNQQQPPKPQPQPKPDSQKPQDQQQPQPKPGDKQEEKAPSGARPDPKGKQDAGKDESKPLPEFTPGQMTPDQAQQLLEAAQSDERPMIFVPPPERRASSRPKRDW